MSIETIITQTSQKIAVKTAAAALALPVAQGDGPPLPSISGTASKLRKWALVLTASTAATTLSGASIFVWLDGGWRKHSAIANPTFAAGDLSTLVIVDNLIGDNVTIAGTVGGAGTITATLYPLEVEG